MHVCVLCDNDNDSDSTTGSLSLPFVNCYAKKKNVKRLKNRDVIQPAKSQQRERERDTEKKRAKISTKLYLFIICQT